MKYDKTLYGESDLFEMIDASEERSTSDLYKKCNKDNIIDNLDFSV